MAFAAVSAPWYFPTRQPGGAFAPNFTGITLDSATEYTSHIFVPSTTGPITEIGFRSASVVAAGTMDVTIETVTGQGPSGTLVNNSASASIPIPTANTWYTVTLDSAASVTAGTAFAVKLSMTTTAGAIGNVQATQMGADTPYTMELPFGCRFQGTTSARTTRVHPMSLRYSDGSYPYTPGVYPISALSTNTFSSTTGAFDEWGAVFSLPFPTRVIGAWVAPNCGTAGSTRVLLYDADTTTVLQALDIDLNSRSGTGATSMELLFASATTLVAAGSYRLTLVPMTPTNIVTTSYVCSAAVLLTNAPYGGRFIETRRVNSGAWTNDAREVPANVGIICDAFDDATGAGATTVVTGGAWGF